MAITKTFAAGSSGRPPDPERFYGHAVRFWSIVSLSVLCLDAGGACHRAGDDAAISAVVKEYTMKADISNLSNDDVDWHGTTVGFYASLKSERAKRLGETNAEAVMPELINALSDADKFVAAHVLLTFLSHVEYSTFPSWNGLEVDIQADGQINIDAMQRHKIARRWKRWYQSESRPATLPSE